MPNNNETEVTQTVVMMSIAKALVAKGLLSRDEIATQVDAVMPLKDKDVEDIKSAARAIIAKL